MVAEFPEEVHPEEAVIVSAARNDGCVYLVFPVRPDKDIIELDVADGVNRATNHLRHGHIHITRIDVEPLGKARTDRTGSCARIEEEGGLHLFPPGKITLPAPAPGCR